MTDDSWFDPTQSYVATACVWEAMSRKVGNVHPNASFADKECATFLVSAGTIAGLFTYRKDYASVGETIYKGVSRTRKMVGTNTNLGILLLVVPLAQPGPRRGAAGMLADTLPNCCGSVADANWVYNAIRLAQPGGLGDATEQDVRDEPTVTLLEAMTLAADRDLIARQYANGFADVFDFGVPAFLAGFERFGCVEAAVIDCQLRWLAEYPDSLIARKNDPAVAEHVRRQAADVLLAGGLATPEGRAAGVGLDRHLRSDGNKLNPGTTADLVTACLFVALRKGKVKPSAPFKWDVPDWL